MSLVSGGGIACDRRIPSESEHKAERQRAKHAELAAQGAPSGGTRPFGLTEVKRDPGWPDLPRARTGGGRSHPGGGEGHRRGCLGQVDLPAVGRARFQGH
jgi:hypothetical protein